MSTPSSIFKHPTHPMLIVFPSGLWSFGFLSLTLFMITGSPTWDTVARYCIAAGVIGGIAAAIPGAIDLLAMPPSRAKSIAWWHAGVMVLVLVLFASAFLLRLNSPAATPAFWLALSGIVLLIVGGWLGGELVYVHGVGVEFEGKERREERMKSMKQDEK